MKITAKIGRHIIPILSRTGLGQAEKRRKGRRALKALVEET